MGKMKAIKTLAEEAERLGERRVRDLAQKTGQGDLFAFAEVNSVGLGASKVPERLRMGRPAGMSDAEYWAKREAERAENAEEMTSLYERRWNR